MDFKLILERCKETFNNSIVLAIAIAKHTALDLLVNEAFLKLLMAVNGRMTEPPQ
jgi:hypothetical protein